MEAAVRAKEVLEKACLAWAGRLRLRLTRRLLLHCQQRF